MRIRDPENVHTDADPGGCTPKITTKSYHKSLILTIFVILLLKAKFKCYVEFTVNSELR